MNHIGLFVAGVLVTLIVAASLALLVWGAILDGREDQRQRALRFEEEVRASRRSRANVQSIRDRVPPHAA